MRKRQTYKKDLMKRLNNERYARAYLNAAFEDEDGGSFLLALRDVAASRGGMSKVAAVTGISREHAYRMLSENGNPELATLRRLLSAFDLKLSIASKKHPRKAA